MTAETLRPKNKQANTSPAMHFQERDGAMLEAIYEYDGILARRHLKQMFWHDKTWRAMEMRLSKLHGQGYLDWPNAKERQIRAIPEPICWLGWKGVLWLASERGIQVEEPKSSNESQLRLLERRLREAGIHWLREPRWSQLKHDLAIVDVRLAVEKAVKELPFLELETWIHESAFRFRMDVVHCTVPGANGRVKPIKKGVRPDGFFIILDKNRLGQSLPARARFLLELDLASHDNPSFGREKVIPGLAYLKSPAYKARFGANSGRWLVISTGSVRLKNLLAQTRLTAGATADIFFFTTFDQIQCGNVLTSPVWWQLGQKDRVALIPSE